MTDAVKMAIERLNKWLEFAGDKPGQYVGTTSVANDDIRTILQRLGQEFDAGEAKAYLYERGDSSFFEREMKPAEFYPNWKITPLYANPPQSRGQAFDGEGEGWRPIESAPKDGTEIILFGPYPENSQGIPTDRVTAGFWIEPEPPVIGDCGGECRCPEYGEPEEPHWCSMHGGSDEGWMSTDGGFTREWPPTHWMPLPDFPALSSAKRGEEG